MGVKNEGREGGCGEGHSREGNILSEKREREGEGIANRFSSDRSASVTSV